MTSKRQPHPTRMLSAALALCLLGVDARSTAPSRSASDCGCEADFEQLVEIVEESYVGYHLGVGTSNEAEYRRVKEAVRTKARSSSADDCVWVLREYVDWFGDGHLFIGESPTVSAAESRRLAAGAARSTRSLDEIFEYLDASEALEPVEGIWFDGQMEIAIVREGDDFEAVCIESSNELWEPGTIKARLTPSTGGEFRAELVASDFTRRNLVGALQKDLLLHMPPFTWGKRAPVPWYCEDLLHPKTPRGPTAAVIAPRVVLFSIPSHSPEHRVALEELVTRYTPDLAEAALLILDLRGDEGGSSGTTRALAPFIETREQRPAIGPAGEPVVAASDRNARFFESLMSQGWIPADLPERIRAATGQVIPFSLDAASPSDLASARAEKAHPERVAIVVDRHVVSAGEAFVLGAMRNTKVTLFGEPTGGMIDYQNVRMVALKCADRGLMVGYPTLAASADLPEAGINAMGIPVDVPLAVEGSDVIRAVVKYYEDERSK